MLPPVFAALKASTAVKDIVGTNPPRIYRHASAPQDTARPYITWALVGGAPENQLSGTPSTDKMVVQVDCWHTTDAGIVALAEAARDAIEPYAHITGYPVNDRDTETKMYRIAIQADWYNDRSL